MNLATPALVVYLMADEGVVELAEAAVTGGATAIELGIPYSDPLADGANDPGRRAEIPGSGDDDAPCTRAACSDRRPASTCPWYR